MLLVSLFPADTEKMFSLTDRLLSVIKFLPSVSVTCIYTDTVNIVTYILSFYVVLVKVEEYTAYNEDSQYVILSFSQLLCRCMLLNTLSSNTFSWRV
jgi:hypothetical protein